MTTVKPSWRSRLRAAWTVLRGHPCAYRLYFEEGVLTFDATKVVGAYVTECTFRGQGPTFATSDSFTK